MMLTTQSYLDKMLVMEAWMLLPEYKEPVKTSMAPVLPHLMGIETWPQQILKLELKNLRLAACSERARWYSAVSVSTLSPAR